MGKQTFNYLQGLSSIEVVRPDGSDAHSSGRSVIGVVVNSKKIYIPLHQVDTIQREHRISPIGYTKNWFAGIIRNKKEFVSVIDLANFPESAGIKEKGKTLIFLVDESISGHYAVLVNRVEETLTVSEIPPRVKAEDTLYTLAYQLNDKTVQVFSLYRLINSQPFADISNF